jgi:hypothetical protein
VSLSLLVALLLISAPPPRDLSLHIVVLGTLLLLSFRFNVALAALVALFVAGIDLRLAYIGVGWTDVADVTRAAIAQVLTGGNPYGVGYAISDPPGAPFAYGPLVLLWYLPFPDPARLDLLISCAIVGLLALRGRPLGLAIYATTPILLLLASDGSNDTSAGLLLLIGLVALERFPRAGAFVLGLAVAFKPYALAWLPPLLAWGGLAASLPLIAGAGLFWLPAILAWGAGSILTSFRMTDAAHDLAYYSLGQALIRWDIRPPAEMLNTLRFVIGGATALVVMVIVRSHRGVVLGGAAIMLATLYTGFWSTYAYLAALAPVACWYLDDWLGLARRIRWPFDPWGTFTAELDHRWPPREPRQRAADAGVESAQSSTGRGRRIRRIMAFPRRNR